MADGMGGIRRVAIMAAMLWAPPVLAQAPMHVVLACHDYPPLIGEKLPDGGMLTRVVKESFARSHVTVTVHWVPNKRAISGVMEGLYDGSFGWAHTPERDAKLLYSASTLYAFRMVFFQRRGATYPWKTLEDLAPHRIGVTLGNHYSDAFTRLQETGRLRVDAAPVDAQNMMKLFSGRIDLFPMEEEAGQVLVDQLFPPKDRRRITYQTQALSEVATHVVIRRTHPQAQQLIDRFDRGFRELAAQGRVKAMMEDTRRRIRKQGGLL